MINGERLWSGWLVGYSAFFYSNARFSSPIMLIMTTAAEAGQSASEEVQSTQQMAPPFFVPSVSKFNPFLVILGWDNSAVLRKTTHQGLILRHVLATYVWSF